MKKTMQYPLTEKIFNEERDSFIVLLENPAEPTKKARLAMYKYLKE
jgi:uncharacterized protein (DUF1778 family)